MDKGYATLEEIRKKSGSSSIKMMVGNLASQRSVLNLVDNIKTRYDRLHILINCAGIYRTKRYLSTDGIELTFAVNYLSRFLLTNMLLEHLKKNPPSRIINVCGEYHRKGTIDFNNLFGDRKYDPAAANNQAQLANVMFTYELARRLKGTGVTVNCLHPGAIATNIINNDPDFPFMARLLYKITKPFFNSPEKGAERVIYLASSKLVDGVSGKYFVENAETLSSRESFNLEISKHLWEVSNNLLATSF
jgi:NAD(P)-dependent dehydrogenase (short-subunit alcohol dehydrogenase family)